MSHAAWSILSLEEARHMNTESWEPCPCPAQNHWSRLHAASLKGLSDRQTILCEREMHVRHLVGGQRHEQHTCCPSAVWSSIHWAPWCVRVRQCFDRWWQWQQLAFTARASALLREQGPAGHRAVAAAGLVPDGEGGSLLQRSSDLIPFWNACRYPKPFD